MTKYALIRVTMGRPIRGQMIPSTKPTWWRRLAPIVWLDACSGVALRHHVRRLGVDDVFGPVA
jgi:hypothetical protein